VAIQSNNGRFDRERFEHRAASARITEHNRRPSPKSRPTVCPVFFEER